MLPKDCFFEDRQAGADRQLHCPPPLAAGHSCEEGNGTRQLDTKLIQVVSTVVQVTSQFNSWPSDGQRNVTARWPMFAVSEPATLPKSAAGPRSAAWIWLSLIVLPDACLATH